MRSNRILPFLLLSVAAGASAAEKASVKDIIKDGSKFDKKVVTTTGKVAKFEQRTSRAGNSYFVFEVVEEKDKAKVNVYGRGKLDLAVKNGDSVEVTGYYRLEKKVGNQTFRNEIEVKLDEKKPPIKIVKA